VMMGMDGLITVTLARVNNTHRYMYHEHLTIRITRVLGIIT